MLTYLLAIAVGLGSFGLYMSAFFLPELHRKYDLVWSGVGLFYGLVLWVCAGRITGGLLLGQMASVALLGWFSWQTLQLRLATTPLDQRTQMPPSANTPSEVIQATVDQIRTNFQKSADRSPLAARLNQTIDRAEAQWISFTSWIKAIQTTLSDGSASIAPPASVASPAPETPVAANASGLDPLETLDVAELATSLEQEDLESHSSPNSVPSGLHRSIQVDESQDSQPTVESSNSSKPSDKLKNRPRRL